MLGLGLFALEGPDPLGMPDHEEADQAGHRNHRGDHIHQPRSVIVGNEELRGGEGGPGDQNGRPDLQHFGEADEGPDQPEGHDEGEHRQDAAGHGSQGYLAETGDTGQRDDRRTQRAVGHRRSVGDQRQARSLQRTEAQPDEQRGGHGHGSAESGRALKERAKAESDEQQLQAPVLGDAGQALLQHLEAAALHRELVHEDDVQHDPADGEEAVSRAQHGGCTRHARRHVETEDGNQQAPRPGRAALHSAPSRASASAPSSTTTGRQRPVWKATRCPVGS